MHVAKKNVLKFRRKRRIRKKIFGNKDRPRLSVFRSAKHIYAQIIDDTVGATLVSVGSMGKDENKRANKEICKELGKQLAQKCKEKNIEKIVFDKNGNDFHGRVKALADGAKEGGLKF